MTVKFETASFFRSHGKQPRGTGMWAFRAEGTAEWSFSPCMSFTDAKKWAAQQFPGATRVEVGA